MFDIGFWELVLISIIALVVLGPERLPVAMRTVMRWIHTAKEMADAVKEDISQELKLHEMNEKIIKASKQKLGDLDPQLQQSIDEIKQAAQEVTHPYQAKDNNLSETQQEAVLPPNSSSDKKNSSQQDNKA